jgi:hypothetical protein
MLLVIALVNKNESYQGDKIPLPWALAYANTYRVSAAQMAAVDRRTGALRLARCARLAVLAPPRAAFPTGPGPSLLRAGPLSAGQGQARPGPPAVPVRTNRVGQGSRIQGLGHEVQHMTAARQQLVKLAGKASLSVQKSNCTVGEDSETNRGPATNTTGRIAASARPRPCASWPTGRRRFVQRPSKLRFPEPEARDSSPKATLQIAGPGRASESGRQLPGGPIRADEPMAARAGIGWSIGCCANGRLSYGAGLRQWPGARRASEYTGTDRKEPE